MDGIILGLYPRLQLCPLGLTTNYMECSGAHVFTVELLWTVFDKLLPPPSPPPARQPLSYARPKLVHAHPKNDLK